MKLSLLLFSLLSLAFAAAKGGNMKPEDPEDKPIALPSPVKDDKPIDLPSPVKDEEPIDLPSPIKDNITLPVEDDHPYPLPTVTKDNITLPVEEDEPYPLPTVSKDNATTVTETETKTVTNTTTEIHSTTTAIKNGTKPCPTCDPIVIDPICGCYVTQPCEKCQKTTISVKPGITKVPPVTEFEGAAPYSRPSPLAAALIAAFCAALGYAILL